MLRCQFALQEDRPLTVLCLGAHSDDIEIGCGGTMLELIERCGKTNVHWVVLSAVGERKREAEESARAFLENAEQTIAIEGFRDGFFPYIGNEIKDYFERLKRAVAPDIVFTHCRSDLHQDHRLISDLTWNTFRDHLILEYEIPKYDGDMGSPNFFVHLKESTCSRKIEHMIRYFPSQHDNHWFGDETFRSLLRLRGIESNAPEKYAEAFYCRKIVW